MADSKLLVLGAEDSELSTNLENIIKQLESGNYETVNNIDGEIFRNILNKNNQELKTLAARTIAELAKRDEYRKKLSSEDIVKELCYMLEVKGEENKRQACRALGNLCCDCDEARTLLSPKISSVLILAADSEPGPLRLCCCRLLLNYMLGGPSFVQCSLQHNALNTLHKLIRHEFESSQENEDCLTAALLALSVILENQPSLVLDNELNLLIVEILKETKNIEISEMCLEHLHAQCEHDEVKTMLATAALPQLLWSLLQQHRSLAVDDETKQLMKLACDLIVLILTGDDSMHLLYADGTGEVYQSMIKWLDSDDDELIATAVLAIGNFARTDSHCVHMMDTGVYAKLLSILSQHKDHEDDIRLQHAVLSGLRNLVIPHRNKPLSIEKGTLPILIEMLPNVSQYNVVFKLLATLRMLVDGQEHVAEELVSSGVLSRVSYWGTHAEHAGAAGEAPRLLAWIVKQLHSRNFLSKIIEIEGSVQCLVNMLVATHAIMQNEAIVSLSILSVSCLSENSSIDGDAEKLQSISVKDDKDGEISDSELKNKFEQEMVKADIGKNVSLLVESNIIKIQAELLENVVKLLNILCKFPMICTHLNVSNIHTALDKLLAGRSDLQEELIKSIKKVTVDIQEASKVA